MNKWLTILFFIWVQSVDLYAQNTIVEFKEEQSNQVINDWQNRSEWMPAVLSATRIPLHTIVQFYGRHVAWALRGEKGTAIVIDGIHWDSPLKSWRLADLYSGLQTEVHVSESRMNGAFSEQGYVANSNVRFLNTVINERKRSFSMGLNFSNSFFSNTVHLHFNNEFKSNQWQYSVGGTFQQSPPGLLSNGFNQSRGIVITGEKQISNLSNIGLSLIWNWSDQGKSASTVNEVLALVQNRKYNPTWGWLHNQLYFPNTKQSNAPVLVIKYQKKWEEYKTLEISNSVILGKQSQSNLEWTKSADPRPDYYRYLPSYIKDSAMRLALTKWEYLHPENLQIQFDKLEQVNRGSKDKRSFYIVNQQNEKLFMMHGAIKFSNRTSNNFGFQFGANYAADHIHYYNSIKDLLGGNYYYNYNSWINDDGAELSFQNDIINPDRKIKAGENWGADYAMNSIQFKPWVQFEKEWPVVTSMLAIGYGIGGINRVGYNKNGLLLNNTNRKSNIIFTPTWDLKAGITYRVNGRAAFNSILFSQWVAPSIEQLYINPELHAILSPYMLTSLHYGIDLGFQYNAPSIKISTSIYWKRIANQSIQKMFYHDGYASFVYGIAGYLNEIFTGVEASLELNLLQNISVSVVSTLQKSSYENDPQYQILYVNDLHLMESGLLHLKHLISSQSPSIVNALSIHYQPYISVQLNCTLLFEQNRTIAIDLFRRSDFVKNKIDAISWGRLVAENKLPDNSFLNISIFKSFQFNKSMHLNKCRLGLSVNNALNNFLPIVAYEQSRFDYKYFDANKYAPKYLIDQGIAYALHFLITIQ